MCFSISSHDFTDVQTLYRQSTEHAAEQSHLIRQLEELNVDTQRVLMNQEEAHTADTTSYQQVQAGTNGKLMTIKFSFYWRFISVIVLT